MMPRKILSLTVAALLWLLHCLPLSVLAYLGCGLGRLLYALGKRRRKIVETNLRLCFPTFSAADLRRTTRQHFELLGRSLLERSLFWWSSPQRLRRLVRLQGEEKISQRLAAGQPVILLAPHFLGLDAGGVAIAMHFNVVSIYSKQKDPIFDHLLYAGRKRFGDQLLLSRQEGARPTVKAMKSGRPLYYLPDMDFGERDSLFVPFFGVPAATITGLSRLAHAARAAVIPCVTRMLPGGQGYQVEVGDAWDSFPTDDTAADTRRMNAFIEETIRSMPAQYYWVHRRFKTRPPGSHGLY